MKTFRKREEERLKKLRQEGLITWSSKIRPRGGEPPAEGPLVDFLRGGTVARFLSESAKEGVMLDRVPPSLDSLFQEMKDRGLVPDFGALLYIARCSSLSQPLRRCLLWLTYLADIGPAGVRPGGLLETDIGWMAGVSTRALRVSIRKKLEDDGILRRIQRPGSQPRYALRRGRGAHYVDYFLREYAEVLHAGAAVQEVRALVSRKRVAMEPGSVTPVDAFTSYPSWMIGKAVPPGVRRYLEKVLSMPFLQTAADGIRPSGLEPYISATREHYARMHASSGPWRRWIEKARHEHGETGKGVFLLIRLA